MDISVWERNRYTLCTQATFHLTLNVTERDLRAYRMMYL